MTIKAYTDLPRSKILAEFLPPESADAHYWCKDGDDLRLGGGFSIDKELDIPAWSLVALLNTLPSVTLDSSNDHHYRLHCKERFTEWYDNPIDTCYEMITKLHELNLL